MNKLVRRFQSSDKTLEQLALLMLAASESKNCALSSSLICCCFDRGNFLCTPLVAPKGLHLSTLLKLFSLNCDPLTFDSFHEVNKFFPPLVPSSF